jgi:hypothetical protein
MFRFPVRLMILLLGLMPVPARSDEFTYIDERGETVNLTARLLGEGQGFQALERNDGQIQIVPTAAIQSRDNSRDHAPFNCDQMAQRLQELFTPELTRIEIQKPVVVAMVLAAPLEKGAESHAQSFLRKAARFMANVSGVFEKYAQSMHFPLREIEYPIVLVIFEADQDFDTYANEATGGRGLSASAITGFYSALTNWLAVRMSACDSFEVPLHEAVHQQMYNRVFQRLAPIPKWFDEGIATGFEGKGDRIDSSPAKVNSRYARLAMNLPRETQWSTVIGSDEAFSADVLAGDAYTLAWCIHWMLATEHKENYQKYVETLSQRKPLANMDQSERLEHFEATFGVSIPQLQAQFPQALQVAVRKQRVKLNQPLAEVANSQQALGQFNIEAVRQLNLGGQLQVHGILKNISPLRAMTFYVTVETGGGVYADWLVPDVRPNQQVKLPTQLAAKPLQGGSAGAPNQYRVFVKSVPANSPDADQWKSGQVPGPVTAER